MVIPIGPKPTRMVFTTWLVTVLITDTVELPLDTYNRLPSWVTTKAFGFIPTDIQDTTLAVVVFITDTIFDP